MDPEKSKAPDLKPSGTDAPIKKIIECPLDATYWGMNTSLLSSTVVAMEEESVMEVPQQILIIDLDATADDMDTTIVNASAKTPKTRMVKKLVKEEPASWIVDNETENIVEDEIQSVQNNATNLKSDDSVDVKRNIKIKPNLSLNDVQDVKVKLSASTLDVKVKTNLSILDSKVDVKNVIIKKSESMLETVKEENVSLLDNSKPDLSTIIEENESIIATANGSNRPIDDNLVTDGSKLAKELGLVNDDMRDKDSIESGNLTTDCSTSVRTSNVIDDQVTDTQANLPGVADESSNKNTMDGVGVVSNEPKVESSSHITVKPLHKLLCNAESHDKVVSDTVQKSDTDTDSSKVDHKPKNCEDMVEDMSILVSDSLGEAIDKDVSKSVPSEIVVINKYSSRKDANDEYVELDDNSNDVFEEECEKKDSQMCVRNAETKSSKTVKENRNVWICNINPNSTASSLKLYLTKFGKVVTAKIVTNGEKYYGYAIMEKEEYSIACIENLNNTKLNGYDIVVTNESPKRSTASSKDVKSVIVKVKPAEKKKPQETNTRKRSRKRSISPDPLTLKVAVKQKCPRDAKVAEKEKEKAREIRRRSRSRSDKRRLESQKREADIKLAKQRALEIELNLQRRKLDFDKREFERQKNEFLKAQKKFEADTKRQAQERELFAKQQQEVREREELRQSRLIRRRSKSVSPKRTAIKSIIRQRKRTPTPLRKSYRQDYKDTKRSQSPKWDTRSNRQQKREMAVPPPPRLTNDDLKNDPWKKAPSNENKKPKLDYHRSPDFSLDRPDFPIPHKIPEVRASYPQTTYNNENRYERRPLLDTYDKPSFKYQKEEHKKRLYENNNRKDMHKPIMTRVDTYPPTARSGGGNGFMNDPPARRYGEPIYPAPYNRAYVPNQTYQPCPMSMPMQQQPLLPQPLWNNKPNYNNKVYHPPNILNKNLIIPSEHRYDNYDKRNTYFSQNRKY